LEEQIAWSGTISSLGDEAFVERLEVASGSALKRGKPVPKPKGGNSG